MVILKIISWGVIKNFKYLIVVSILLTMAIDLFQTLDPKLFMVFPSAINLKLNQEHKLTCFISL